MVKPSRKESVLPLWGNTDGAVIGWIMSVSWHFLGATTWQVKMKIYEDFERSRYVIDILVSNAFYIDKDHLFR